MEELTGTIPVEIFNEFLLSALTEENANLIKELRVRWRAYQSRPVYIKNPELEKALKQSKPDTSKERIEVNIGTADSGGDRGRPHRYQLVTSHPIKREHIPLIKQKVESALNGDNEISFGAKFHKENFFTKQQMDKAIEDTWKACRETTGQPIGRGEYNDGDCGDIYRNKYPTLESYLQTIKK